MTIMLCVGSFLKISPFKINFKFIVIMINRHSCDSEYNLLNIISL